MDLNETQKMIEIECDRVKNLLLSKNRDYGNSALSPARVFSKSDPVEQLKVRIDDKLTRINNLGEKASHKEDTVLDLIGYLVLLRVAEQFERDEKAKRSTTNVGTLYTDDESLHGTIASWDGKIYKYVYNPKLTKVDQAII